MRKIPDLKKTLAHLFLGTTLSAAACSPQQYGGREPADVDDPAGDQQDVREVTGRVRALHLARSAPPLKLTFDDGQPMVDSLTFGGVTGDVDMATGDHAFNVLPAGGTETIVTSDALALAEDASWSLYMWGNEDEMHASLLADNGGRGYRVINTLPGGASIGARLRAGGSDVINASLSPGNVSAFGSGADDENTLAVDTDGDGEEDATFTLPAAEGERSTDLFVVPSEDGTTVSILACSDRGLVEVPADQAVPNAKIRALHLSPNAPNVDVFVNGGAAITNLAFENSSGYASLPPGRYDFDIAPTGAGIGSAVLSVDGLELLSTKAYTAVAYGNLPNIRALALEDDETPVSPGNIRVRAAHTADGVGQVDVLAVTDAGNALVYDDVDFGSVSAYIEIPAAAIKLGLDLDDDLTPELVFDVPALPIGTIATLFAVIDDDGVALFAATQDGQATIRGAAPTPPPPPASIRVVHLSPDAPAVAISANGEQIVESLEFFNATQFVDVAAGTTDLDVALASAPDAAILSVVGAELAPGSKTTAVAFGRASELRALALAEDATPPAAGNIRVRPVHTAVGVGNVDIYAATPSGHVKLFDNVAFGTAGEAIEVPAGQYHLALDLNEDAHPDLTFALPALAEGTIANVFAVTNAAGQASLALQPLE